MWLMKMNRVLVFRSSSLSPINMLMMIIEVKLPGIFCHRGIASGNPSSRPLHYQSLLYIPLDEYPHHAAANAYIKSMTLKFFRHPSCCYAHTTDFTFTLLAGIFKRGFALDTVLINALIQRLFGIGLEEDAYDLFIMLTKKTCFNPMLTHS
ncbi:unnamed protein product [Cuscuta campestris]|uniref:Uncharacterized protein n=1 Tax=Cuscuta campestris TaxID=132261 RepID=A0A484L1F4_9ASTE|nr:unnamed protein product [Cuscuta campestris]